MLDFLKWFLGTVPIKHNHPGIALLALVTWVSLGFGGFFVIFTSFFFFGPAMIAVYALLVLWWAHSVYVKETGGK